MINLLINKILINNNNNNNKILRITNKIIINVAII